MIRKEPSKVQVFRGRFCLPWNPVYRMSLEPEKNQKVIVFDLDETLGSFGDLYIIWAGIQHISPEFSEFDRLLDLYPEFIRYGIYQILGFLYQKKKTGECTKIYIYTNNQCPNTWISYLLQYFHNKIKDESSMPLFDNIIGAFKIRNKRIELSRTSHSKSYQDFIRCTLLPNTTEICFMDDTEYEKMKHDKIYYICPQSYIHCLSVREIIARLIAFDLWKIDPILRSEDYWMNWFQIHGRNDSGYIVDMNNVNIKIGKKMMYYVKEFFLLSTKCRCFQTRKKKQHIHKTRKKMRNMTILRSQ